jgi:hypothetical protein
MLVESCGSSAHAWDRATASTGGTTAATTSRQRGLDDPGGGARPEQAPLAPEQRGDRWRSRVATWAHSTAAAELAWRLLWWCRPCRRTPASRSASSASRRAARAGPSPTPASPWAGTPYLPCVGRPTASWRRGGGGCDVTDERRPRPNPPPDQRPDSNQEFRRALERATDLSLREDPERRRMYTSMDLPHSRSPSDDRSLPPRRHHRYDELTWNGQTLTLIGWSQRTGIHVEVLLRRCRRGWSVEQVLTTPLGEDRPGPHPTS